MAMSLPKSRPGLAGADCGRVNLRTHGTGADVIRGPVSTGAYSRDAVSQLSDAPTQGCLFGFALAQAFGPFLRDRVGLFVFAHKCDARFVGSAPYHTRPERTLSVRYREIELVGHACDIGECNFGTIRRKIPHVATHGGFAPIKRNGAAEISARTYALSSFVHRRASNFRGPEYQPGHWQQPLAAGEFALVLNRYVSGPSPIAPTE